MQSKTTHWFEAKVTYPKTMGNGLVKKTSEFFTIEAVSFTEAEARAIQEMSAYTDEIEVTALKHADYQEVIFTNVEADDRWYKVKMAYITVDEKTGNEKRNGVNYLIQSESLECASKSIKEFLHDSFMDYTIECVKETKILDVIECQSK